MNGHQNDEEFNPYEGFEDYDFSDPAQQPRRLEQQVPESLFDKMWHHPIFKGLAALGVLIVGIKVVWMMTEAFSLPYRMLIAVVYILGFIYLCAEIFTPTVILFASISLGVLFIKGFVKLTEHQWTIFAVIYAVVIPVLMIGFWYYWEKHRLRCEKCGWTLEEKHLLDEETVSMYKCPKCRHVTKLKW